MKYITIDEAMSFLDPKAEVSVQASTENEDGRPIIQASDENAQYLELMVFVGSRPESTPEPLDSNSEANANTVFDREQIFIVKMEALAKKLEHAGLRPRIYALSGSAVVGGACYLALAANPLVLSLVAASAIISFAIFYSLTPARPLLVIDYQKKELGFDGADNFDSFLKKHLSASEIFELTLSINPSSDANKNNPSKRRTF